MLNIYYVYKYYARPRNNYFKNIRYIIPEERYRSRQLDQLLNYNFKMSSKLKELWKHVFNYLLFFSLENNSINLPYIVM